MPRLFDRFFRVQFAFFGGQLSVQLRGLEIGARVGERGEGLMMMGVDGERVKVWWSGERRGWVMMGVNE